MLMRKPPHLNAMQPRNETARLLGPQEDKAKVNYAKSVHPNANLL